MIEDEIFKKSEVNLDKLIKYGFKKEGNIYKYQTNFMNDDFSAIITFDNNKIEGKVYDLLNDLEYLNLRLINSTSSFINKVQNNYIDILNDIKKNCFNEKYFIFNQTNRITNYIINKYHDYPEYLWKDSPNFGVFRNKKNSKWYGIIMNINRKKLDNYDLEVEIINIKLEPSKISELIKKNGFYLAYHMNKKYWISIILDDTICDNEIFKLIDESYTLVC